MKGESKFILLFFCMVIIFTITIIYMGCNALSSQTCGKSEPANSNTKVSLPNIVVSHQVIKGLNE